VDPSAARAFGGTDEHDGPVPEYLIRPVGRAEWVPVPRDRLADVLVPQGCGARVIPGWGDLRVQIDRCEMAFSGEEVGWQVLFDGVAGPDTDSLVAQVADQLAVFAGEPMEWVRYA
jgi:hypothetical protein